MGEKVKNAVAEWMDKLIKEHARELLMGLLNQYGVTLILAQVISILRSTKDDSLMSLSKDLEKALDNHESKNAAKQVGKKIGYVPTSAEEAAAPPAGSKKKGFFGNIFAAGE